MTLVDRGDSRRDLKESRPIKWHERERMEDGDSVIVINFRRSLSKEEDWLDRTSS